MIEFISQLPTAYQEVEYIQSSGTQYIDTGFVPNNNTEIMLVFTNTNATTGNYYCIFGTRTTANNDNTFALWIDTNRRFGAFYVTDGAGQSLTPFPTSINVTAKHTAVMKGRVAEIDSVSVTCPATSSSPAYSFYIGACNTAGTADYFSKILIYESKIYDNEILVRDFVPCYRKADNVAGLYDLVTGTFFTNAGSGTFAVGNNSNKRDEWIITAGGMIPLQFALRRRRMQSHEKTWTVTIQNNAAGDASPYYPKINGIASGPGIYKVRDGDVITLYGHVGAYEEYYVSVIYIDGQVWHANYGQTISQQHIARTDCNIVISSEFSHGYNYITKLTTT